MLVDLKVLELASVLAGVQGVKNYIGKEAGGWKLENGLLPPPHLGEHTEEVVNKLS